MELGTSQLTFKRDGFINVHTFFFIRIAAVVTTTISIIPPATLPPIIQARMLLFIDSTKKTRQLLPILNRFWGGGNERD